MRYLGGKSKLAKRIVDAIYADRASRTLLRKAAILRNKATFACLRFEEIAPHPTPWVIYADPPYAGTTGYDAAGAFDTDAFWARCVEWAAFGVRVYVSEFATPPVPHTRILEIPRKIQVAGGRHAVDRLFCVEVA